MAKALKCDLCGNLFEYSLNMENRINMTVMTENGCVANKTIYDVCPDCMGEILKVIRQRKKEENNE